MESLPYCIYKFNILFAKERRCARESENMSCMYVECMIKICKMRSMQNKTYTIRSKEFLQALLMTDEVAVFFVRRRRKAEPCKIASNAKLTSQLVSL